MTFILQLDKRHNTLDSSSFKLFDMNAHEFNRLSGLVAKLKLTTTRAKQRDRSFSKHYVESLNYLSELNFHLGRIEQGLTTGKFMDPNHDEIAKANSLHQNNAKPRSHSTEIVELRLRRAR